MTPDELPRMRVQRVEPAGILYQPHRLVVWGIHGAGAYVLGMQVGDSYLARRQVASLNGDPPETVDQLRERAMRDVVPHLPPNCLRDRNGSAVGYFIYEGLPADHC